MGRWPVTHAAQHIATNSSSESKILRMRKSMRQRIRSWWGYITRRGGGSSEQSRSSRRKASPSGKWFQGVHDCTLYAFRVCLCDNDLQALVIEGPVPEKELKKTWEVIFQDYADGVSGETEKTIAMMVKKIDLLQFRIKKTIAIQAYLSVMYDKEMVEFLKHIGAADSSYPIREKDREIWWRRVNGRVKRWITERDQEEKRLAALRKSLQDSTFSNGPTHENFQEFIVQIEQYMKFHINEHETTVGRFVAMVKD